MFIKASHLPNIELTLLHTRQASAECFFSFRKNSKTGKVLILILIRIYSLERYLKGILYI